MNRHGGRRRRRALSFAGAGLDMHFWKRGLTHLMGLSVVSVA